MLIYLGVVFGTSLYALNPAHASSITATYSKVRSYMLQSTSMMFRWCLVAACFDRYVLSSTNLRLRNFSNMRIARRVIVMIIVVWLVLPVHDLIFYIGSLSIFHTMSDTAILYYHSIFSATLRCILPASIMITCALLIHRNLGLKRKRRQLIVFQQGQLHNKTIDNERKRDLQVLIILISQVGVFIIAMTALMIYLFYNAATISITNKSTERIFIKQFAYFWIELSIDLFPTSSFYLYTMTSSMFRGELVNMIRSVLPWKYSRTIPRIGTMTNTIEDRTDLRQKIGLAVISLSRGPKGQADEIV